MKKIIKSLLFKLGYRITPVESIKLKQVSSKVYENPLNGDAGAPYNNVPFAAETLQYFVENYSFQTVLDIGSGEGSHSEILKNIGKEVTSIDFGKSIYFEKRNKGHTCIFGNYYDYDFESQFDAIWVSHVLEHQPNPNLFLKKIHKDLKEGGVLALTVPPLKHEIVGGHVTLWNAGLLMYQLVLAGFNCRDISIKSYGYNISILLKKQTVVSMPDLSYDKGDIEKLASFFPEGITEPFEGRINKWNW